MALTDTRPPLPELAEFQKRRSARNWALLIVLVGIAALFYAISMVRFKVS